jgi:hypothetical protein
VTELDRIRARRAAAAKLPRDEVTRQGVAAANLQEQVLAEAVRPVHQEMADDRAAVAPPAESGLQAQTPRPDPWASTLFDIDDDRQWRRW